MIQLIEMIERHESRNDFMNQTAIKAVAKQLLDVESQQHFERFLEGFKYSREGFNGETFDGKSDSVIAKNIVEDYNKTFGHE